MRIGVIDFFSGCGGASHGFSQASTSNVSYEVIAGIDNDPHSCATFAKMHGAPAYQLDIACLVGAGEDRLAELIAEWRLDRFDKIVLIGCAPCQGFAAHRKASKGYDNRRSLFGIFAEIAVRISPDAIFMENVPDMFSKKHWEHYEAGRSVLEKGGYQVRSRVYNFAEFGLPQERFRAVVIASKTPFNMPVPPIDHRNYSTVRDAIGRLLPLAAGESDPNDPMHIVSRHRQSTVDLLSKIPKDGGNRPVGVGPACLDRAREKHGGYTDVYGRLAWNRPAVTITARCRTPSCGRFAHPEQNRGLSVREAALLQGFPHDFQFEGPFDDKYKQIGNAVPPLVAKRIALFMISIISGELGDQLMNDVGLDIIKPVGPGFAVTINGIKKKRLQKAAIEEAN